MDNETGGRLYHLRPRLVPAEPPSGQVLNLDRRRANPKPPELATVHVFPAGRDPNEVVIGATTRLDYAWAAHQRVYGVTRSVNYRRVVSGGEVGLAKGLLEAQRLARAMPDCEDFMEALQLRNRTIVEVFESVATMVRAADEHDCDCTCAGEDGHVRWIIEPEAWRPVRVGALLRRLARDEQVKVRLGPVASKGR